MKREGLAALGLDLGSTTVKYVLLDVEKNVVLKECYKRHGSAVIPTLAAMIRELDRFMREKGLANLKTAVRFTGSGALSLSKTLGIPFVQEVVAAADFLRHDTPDIDACVELGGEDAKILYLSNGIELRMNEACAGGTGAFIDQAATLLKTDAAGLDAFAREAKRIYPVASRCGVFAKTDFINLLNNGVSKADIAKSIFAAVAEQAVSGLACGRPLTGKIAFLGGPLSFLPSLREAFRARIGETKAQFLETPRAHFAVAHGAALDVLQARKTGEALGDVDLLALAEALDEAAEKPGEASLIPPLFKEPGDYEAFARRHAKEKVPTVAWEGVTGPLYLGVDLGSTTVKGAVMTEAGDLCRTWYESNDGEPLVKLLAFLRDVLDTLPKGAYIRAVCSTGYGATLAQSALSAQWAEVETLAHQRAARAFDPDTTFVIDIGGQDMKCLKVEDGRIVSVTLNEACSSGCGAFLETFARQLNMTTAEFVQAALASRAPCDLGSRCTVFMNSKVRQAQREGATTNDIAAGLCVSIVRNALHKVLRLKSTDDLGGHVVVQGGTFLNDAVLRVFETHTGLAVIRPDLAGLMGAYGAALLARDKTPADAPDWNPEDVAFDLDEARKIEYRCGGCGNRCQLTMYRFPSGRKFISGNRCDFALKGKGGHKKNEGFIEKKLAHLFGCEILPPEEAPRGSVGIPRVLNMYEHFPFWAAVFKTLGFHVTLSPASTQKMLTDATDTVPSQSLCLPVKLAHGHIVWLANAGVKDIWFPCAPREPQLCEEADDSYACPIVGGYPEALKLNLEKTAEGLRIHTPFLRIDKPDTVVKALKAWVTDASSRELKAAVAAGERAMAEYRAAVRDEARALWESDEPLVILAAHPYHLDPFVHHGIPDLLVSMGHTVLTEDAVAYLADEPLPVDVVNQWAFHSRLYRAAQMAVKRPHTELIQMVSFGCGIDAITSEQVKRILAGSGRLYTMLKIDETDSLGSARIRLASHFSAVADREGEAQLKAVGPNGLPAEPCIKGGRMTPSPLRSVHADAPQRTRPVIPIRAIPHAVAAQDVVRDRKIYMPQMAPVHFPLLAAALKSVGIDAELLPDVSDEAIDLGLRYVNNDACYPAIVVIGQLLEKAREPGFEAEKSAFLLAQTCGPCRATNYGTLLGWALKDIGFPDLPVVSLTTRSFKDVNNQLKLGMKEWRRLLHATLFGDLLQRLTLHGRAYEKTKGETEALLARWQTKLSGLLAQGRTTFSEGIVREIVADFARIPKTDATKPSVGIVGEILLKYHPKANQSIIDKILAEGAEPRLGDISSFILYCFFDNCWQRRHLAGGFWKAAGASILIKALSMRRGIMDRALRDAGYPGVETLDDLLRSIESLVTPGQEAGEGWLLTAEMVQFVKNGTPNVLCLQPFACLPNHITGRGTMRAIRERYEGANVCGIDFEASTSETNVANRLKLFLSNAFENEA